MTERYDRDPHPGLVDRLAELLFPSLFPDPPGAQACIGPCVDHDHAKAELEAEP
jgi:hypothetical protein